MTPPDLEAIVRAVRELPSLPVIVMELLEAMENEAFNSAELAKKILRLANSSFYGASGRVTTVAQAMSILGLSTVRAVVTAVSISGAFVIDRHTPFNFSQFWKHATATAICAKHLAPLQQVAPDIAFITGLLHDIGQLVLATQFPDAFAAVIEQCCTNDYAVVEVEQQVLQTDHAAVGAALTAHWRFPLLIQHAVAWHHTDDLCGTEPLAAIIHIANALAHALDLTDDPMEAVPRISESAWQLVMRDPGLLNRMLPRIEAEFLAINSILTA